MRREALSGLAAALAASGATLAVRGEPGPPTARYVRGVPAGGATAIEGRVTDPYGLPPGVPRATRAGWPAPPPWAVLVWRTADGRVCHEAGAYVDDDTPGRGDQIPGVRALEAPLPSPLVGSMRPEARSGTGIQFYDVGRFLAYPTREGGSCGDPTALAGLVLAREHRHARRDHGPDRTVISGVAGPRVRRIEIAGRAVTIGARHRTFLALYDGLRAPRELPVTVLYADGTRRTFAG